MDLVSKLIFFIVMGIILGNILSALDFYIYQFFEGFRFWPKDLLEWNYNRILRNFASVVSRYWNLKDKKPRSNKEEIEWSNILYELRNYPCDSKEDYPENRYPKYSTKLGNVIAEYESYSMNKYGMHMLAYWYQLLLLSPTDSRNFLDIRSAISDFCIYVSFICLLSAPLATVGFNLQIARILGDYWIESMISIVLLILQLVLFSTSKFYRKLITKFLNKWVILICLISCVLIFFIYQVLIHLSSANQLANSILLFNYQNFHLSHFIFIFDITIMIFISLIITSYLFYVGAINALKAYGRVVKAFFDIYRFELATKFGIKLEMNAKDEREIWITLGNSLLKCN